MSDEPQIARLRFRPRFSMLTMLLVTAIVGMAILVWQLWRDVGPLRTEVRRLRNEVGELNIDDKKKIHAIRISTDDDLAWRWRVYLPKERKYRLNIVSNPVPEEGYPENGTYTGSSTSLEGGEKVIEISIRKDAEGVWIARESIRDVGENPLARLSVGSTSLDTQSGWLDNRRGNLSYGVLKAEQISAWPDERFLLLRLRPKIFTPKNPDSDNPLETHVGTSRPAKGPVEGLLIWIDDEDINQ